MLKIKDNVDLKELEKFGFSNVRNVEIITFLFLLQFDLELIKVVYYNVTKDKREQNETITIF